MGTNESCNLKIPDLSMIPAESLIKELLSRSEDLIILRSYTTEKGSTEYEFEYKGEPSWLLKKLNREVIPDLEDEIEETEDED